MVRLGVCKVPGCHGRGRGKYRDSIIHRERYEQGISYTIQCDQGHVWHLSVLRIGGSGE